MPFRSRPQDQSRLPRPFGQNRKPGFWEEHAVTIAERAAANDVDAPVEKPGGSPAWKRWGAIGFLTALVGAGLWSTSGAAVPRAPQTPLPLPATLSLSSSLLSTPTVAEAADDAVPEAVDEAVPEAIDEAVDEAADDATEETPPDVAPVGYAMPAIETAEPAPDYPSAPRTLSGAKRAGIRAAVGAAVAVAHVAKLNRRAMRAYRHLDVGRAQRLLRTALATCARGGLGHHRMAALTHAHLAVVLVNGFNQSQLGVDHFRRALRIDPRVPLSAQLLRPDAVSTALREAATSVRPGA